ncbi:MAG: hypothetical protein WDW38_010842 [Sanguina aurantia]
MQSHASRHVVSEFLKDLHPDLSPPTSKIVIQEEIAAAYGRRSIPKLVSVLGLPELPDDARTHALRVFIGMISTQEQKICAINDGAAIPLTALVLLSDHAEVLTLSCEALSSMAQVQSGRREIATARGIMALTAALQTTPEAAAGALRQFGNSADGVKLLSDQNDLVPALVKLLKQLPGTGVSLAACDNSVATLAAIAVNDAGIMLCLASHVPSCLASLMRRGLSGDFRFEPNLMQLMEQCALALEQIAHHPYGKTSAREADAIKILGQLMVLNHRPALKHASAALLAISVEQESKLPTVMHAGVHLMKLLRGNDEELALTARAALISACEHLEARKFVELLMVDSERESLLYLGAAPPTPPDYRHHIVLP